MLKRRSFITTALTGLIAAPMVIRNYNILMPVNSHKLLIDDQADLIWHAYRIKHTEKTINRYIIDINYDDLSNLKYKFIWTEI